MKKWQNLFALLMPHPVQSEKLLQNSGGGRSKLDFDENQDTRSGHFICKGAFRFRDA